MFQTAGGDRDRLEYPAAVADPYHDLDVYLAGPDRPGRPTCRWAAPGRRRAGDDLSTCSAAAWDGVGGRTATTGRAALAGRASEGPCWTAACGRLARSGRSPRAADQGGHQAQTPACRAGTRPRDRPDGRCRRPGGSWSSSFRRSTTQDREKLDAPRHPAAGLGLTRTNSSRRALTVVSEQENWLVLADPEATSSAPARCRGDSAGAENDASSTTKPSWLYVADEGAVRSAAPSLRPPPAFDEESTRRRPDGLGSGSRRDPWAAPRPAGTGRAAGRRRGGSGLRLGRTSALLSGGMEGPWDERALTRTVAGAAPADGSRTARNDVLLRRLLAEQLLAGNVRGAGDARPRGCLRPCAWRASRTPCEMLCHRWSSPSSSISPDRRSTGAPAT